MFIITVIKNGSAMYAAFGPKSKKSLEDILRELNGRSIITETEAFQIGSLSEGGLVTLDELLNSFLKGVSIEADEIFVVGDKTESI